MLSWLAGMILAAVLALGGYVAYQRSGTTMQQLGDAAHNLWHPDYPSGIP